MSAADRRLAELRVRRAARAANRAAFEERRGYGLRARHAAKLAHLSARAQAARADEACAEAETPQPEAAQVNVA